MAASPAAAAVSFQYKDLTVFSDDTTHRAAHDPPPVPACPSPTSPNAVTTSDIALLSSHPPASGPPSLPARLFLPPPPPPPHKLPVLLYFHGGGFIYGSCTLPPDHTFLCRLASHANILIVAVDYRLAPEHPLPAAYIDGLQALQWLKEQAKLQAEEDQGGDRAIPWLARHGDFRRIYLGGDSAGANIAHHVAMAAVSGIGFEGGEEICGGGRAQRRPAKEVEVEDGCVLQGVILIHPFFTCGEEDIGYVERKLWELNSVPVEHPYADPTRPEAPSLEGAGLPRMMVAVATKDFLFSRGVAYYKALVDAGQRAKLFVSTDEGHVFHRNTPDSPNVLPFLEELKDFTSLS